MEVHERLARSILARAIARPVTHMKLQKLCFYGYGVVRALGGDLGGVVPFRAWKHGPVNIAVYEEYKHHGDQPIAVTFDDPGYAPPTSALLDDVLAVYGRLTAWELRNQSHLEKPWRDADSTVGAPIDDASIVEWFRVRYATGRVLAPDLLVDGGGLDLDGIPHATYPSFRDLAERCRALRG